MKNNFNQSMDKMKNIVKETKETIWGGIKESGDNLCDWFELYDSLDVVYHKIREHVKKSIDLFQEESTTRKILKKINTNSDRYLESNGIHDHVHAIIKTISIM